MARRLLLISLAGVVLIVAVSMWSREPDIIPPPPVPAAQTDGVTCFRQGGSANYCRCLDRLELARRGRVGPGLPSFKDPAVRYALTHPRDYPVINTYTPECLRPRKPAPDGGTPA